MTNRVELPSNSWTIKQKYTNCCFFNTPAKSGSVNDSFYKDLPFSWTQKQLILLKKWWKLKLLSCKSWLVVAFVCDVLQVCWNQLLVRRRADRTPVPAELSQWFYRTDYQLSRHRNPSPDSFFSWKCWLWTALFSIYTRIQKSSKLKRNRFL